MKQQKKQIQWPSLDFRLAQKVRTPRVLFIHNHMLLKSALKQV